MKKPPFLFYIIPFLLTFLACQAFPPVAAPTPTIDPAICASQTEPTQEDIDYSLDFGDSIFSQSGWDRTYTVESQRVSASWTSNDKYSVAYLAYLIFSCGATTSELDIYFNHDYWHVLFQNYEGYEPMDSCGNLSSTMLWEFSAISGGNDYQVRYWAKQVSSTRVLTMFFVYPPTSVSTMNTYASKMFPELMSCSQ